MLLTLQRPSDFDGFWSLRVGILPLEEVGSIVHTFGCPIPQHISYIEMCEFVIRTISITQDYMA